MINLIEFQEDSIMKLFIIIQELFEGEPLGFYIINKNLTILQISFIIKQVAILIQYLQQEQILSFGITI